jgi:hypothetical protein
MQAVVDKLGDVQAQIAQLKLTEAMLKDAVIQLGEGAHEGHVFRATVTSTIRETLPISDAREKLIDLGCSTQWFTAHTVMTPVVTVRVGARTGGNINPEKSSKKKVLA